MGIRYDYKKLYLSKQHLKAYVGRDAPGVGKYI